jgi:hypothetical protein
VKVADKRTKGKAMGFLRKMGKELSRIGEQVEHAVSETGKWLETGWRNIEQLDEDIIDKWSGKRTDKRTAINNASDARERMEAKQKLIKKKNDKKELMSKILSGGNNLMSGGNNSLSGGNNLMSGGQNLMSGGSNNLSSSGKNLIQ